MLIWESRVMQWIQESYAKSNTTTLSDVTLGKKKEGCGYVAASSKC